MKGIYIANLNLQNLSEGVSKKVNLQVDYLEKILGNIEVIDKNSMQLCNRQLLFVKFLKVFRLDSLYITFIMLSKLTSEKKYIDTLDYIYIRKFVFTKYHIIRLHDIKSKNPKIKIILEFPTYPYDREWRFYDSMIALIDRKSRVHLHKVIDRIVTFSKDNQIYGVDTIQISNGIDYNIITPKRPIIHDGIHVIAVALFAKWHGYDRFINGMLEDIELVKKENIVLHLVGNGGVLRKYKRMIIGSEIEEHIIFHGALYGNELDRVYNMSDLALDAMGRHRSDVFYNSSLKGKEYCAKGIPVISGVKTELDGLGEIPYYLRVPADESYISMSSIIEFYSRIYTKSSEEAIINLIRAETKEVFSIEKTMTPVVEYIMS